MVFSSPQEGPMPKPTHDLHLDFETYCDLDLKKVGVHRYVADWTGVRRRPPSAACRRT
jgi:hypothetical protein